MSLWLEHLNELNHYDALLREGEQSRLARQVLEGRQMFGTRLDKRHRGQAEMVFLLRTSPSFWSMTRGRVPSILIAD